MKERNSTVDIMRGIAMLMVVLGHTMTGCTENSQQSFLFNVVWSLQMPLFILISGYVTRYSRAVTTIKELGALIKKRTISYLLPWAVWTFIVRGLIFGQTGYLHFKYMLWHMDNGYWFLFTIWTISLVFGVSHFLCRKVLKGAKGTSKIKAIVLTGVFYVIGMSVLAGIGMAAGMSFLCIKLTLYYMPFFFAGYIYGNLQDDIYALRRGGQIVDCVIVAALVIWLSVITRVNLYDLADSGLGIILRAGASLCGCVAVCGLCAGLFGNAGKVRGGVFRWCGVHSLEIYTVHYLLLCMIQMSIKPEFLSIAGIGLIALNYALTVVLAAVIIQLLNANAFIRRAAFGR